MRPFLSKTILGAILILGAALTVRAQYPQSLSIDIIVAKADQVLMGRVVNSGDTARDKDGRRRGTIVLSVEKTLKGNQMRGSLDLPIANWDDSYPGEFNATTSDSEINSHRLLVALRRDSKNQTRIAAIDLDSASLEIMRADLVALKTSAEVIRAAEDEIRRIPVGGKPIDVFELRAPSYEVKGDPFYGCMIIVPADERLEKRAQQWLSDPDTRLNGVYALRSFKSDENIRLLMALLSDADYPVRQQAYQVLKIWGVEVPKPAPRNDANPLVPAPPVAPQNVSIARSYDAHMPPDEYVKLAFVDANHFYAIGSNRALVYEVGAIVNGRPPAIVAKFDPDTEVRSVTSDGRKAILVITDSPERFRLILLDSTTSKREDIPSSWYDSTDSEIPAALSGDGRLLSIYSEAGPTDSPMTVSVYDWQTKSLVAKRASELISAGGGFGGGVTTDGQIEFVNGRVGSKLVDLKSGRLLGRFGPDSVRSPDGKWVVEFPDQSFNESAPKEAIIKDGTNAQPRGKLNLDPPVGDNEIYGSISGAFCGTTGHFVVARGRTVTLYSIPSGSLVVNFPASSWRDPKADDTTRPTVACSPTGTRVAILSSSRLTFHDLK